MTGPTKEESASRRWKTWFGILAVACGVASILLHALMARFVGPGASHHQRSATIADALILGSGVAALLALALSVACIAKGSRIIGFIALVLSFMAIWNWNISF